jgi:alkaline phosphatase
MSLYFRSAAMNGLSPRLAKTSSAWMTFALIIALVSAMLPTGRSFAQDDLKITILPIDRAQFLPGSKFDFRVEFSPAAAMPADAKVTINGEDASNVTGVQPTVETWELGKEPSIVKVQSMIWRGVTAPAPGDYKIEVTAGGKTQSVNWTVRKPGAGKAKNVILFVGDGMNVGVITAARVMSRGVKQGKYNGSFVFDNWPAMGFAQTSSVDALLADSANTASSLNTGHVGSVNATGTYSDSSPDPKDDPRVETFAQMIKRLRGMSVGVVTTSDWSDATPAAVFGHCRNRGDECRNFMIADVIDSGLNIEVILGGGGRRMLPKATEGSRRADERDLFKEYEAAGYNVVTNATELTEAMKATPERLLGIFTGGDMNVWLDRNVYKDNVKSAPDQPGLVAMTTAALDVLGKNPNGFYLEVESASIDKQMHPMDYDRAIADTIEFERAVAAAAEWAAKNAPDTLIIVTADHSHGYDVYGTVDVTKFNAATDDAGKRSAIGIYNNAKYPTYEDKDGDFFPDNWEPTITLAHSRGDTPNHTEDYQVSKTARVPALCETKDNVTTCVDNPEDDPNGLALGGNLPVNSGSGVHTLADVPVFGTGPGSEALVGVYHQSEIFFVMANAIGLDPSAADGKTTAALNSASPVAASGVATDFNGLLMLVIGVVAGAVLSRRVKLS